MDGGRNSVLVTGLLLYVLLAAGCVQAAEAATLVLTPPTGCNPSAVTGCTVMGAGYRATLKFGSSPRTLTPLVLSLKSDPAPIHAEVQFIMKGMNMGDNRFAFRSEGYGAAKVWVARAMIPACASGRADWIAVVILAYPKRQVEMRVPFTTP
ncbi:hypothetical protein BI364_14475 [Acidihalobacter yilgarnensis]|uniref:Uncharacterized protein n=1 Tax=Acidihalobacter yilgarnensis TaxID=2819280 RepID=A0A1D8IR80_9GAMM|nr:hypothetical protein [Acidihalobacter yilgarnensis]AOU98999.1 hypothetical protein BI364_14475 [Acidihalobacter yilgarnensis]